MPILGIENRTENWKTARCFAPFFTCDSARATLAQKLGEPEDTLGRDIQIELFWKGVRDYLKKEKRKTKGLRCEFAQSYSKCFQGLRDEIEDFNGFNDLKDCNYDASKKYPTRISELSDNLRNTEIDIVLQTPKHLFIGEAKHEEDGFGTDGSYILVHQLIRQYVMAEILVDLTHSDKQVVPF